MFNTNYFLIFTTALYIYRNSLAMGECQQGDNLNNELMKKSKLFIPDLNSGKKGDAGKIGVIGGSVEYTGAPYFTAISALKVGADLIYVFTTSDAAPVIKSYSPELIVYPFLHRANMPKINKLLKKMDVIMIGPGLGRENETASLISEIFTLCKILRKPLIIDADGLYVVSRNLDIIKGYPAPGIILTPNIHEKNMLMNLLPEDSWYKYWGENVGVLIKNKEDKYFDVCEYQWTLSGGGSGRRAGGQGDILAGALGTFFNWAIKANSTASLGRAVSAYAAAVFTRECNFLSYAKHGRSMTASDMLVEIHAAFVKLFE